MRIDKLISEMGLASRRECAALAKRGQILVDGRAVRSPSEHIDPMRQTVTFMGKVVEYAPFTYVMLHKPEGYVSATEDSRLPVVTELLPEELRRRELFPVGRLDKDTTGLMILTNDGALAHALLTPRRHVEKKYRFACAEPMREGSEDYFARGATLADGYVCKSALLECDADRMGGVITLTEGKYHQIKRMVASCGSNKVTALSRLSFGGIELDPDLALGEWRPLTDSEISHLRSEAE
jgi:16S rRNA pseudouridine516 synthase